MLNSYKIFCSQILSKLYKFSFEYLKFFETPQSLQFNQSLIVSSKSMDLQQKRKFFQAHLQEQNRKRQQQLQQKKIQQSSKNNPQEDMLFIQKTFRQKQKQFQDLATQYKEKKVVFDELQKCFNRLKQYYLEVNYVLMTYDRQFYKQVLQKIYNSMIQLKKKYEPRKKFKFSRRQEDFGVKLQQNKNQVVEKKVQTQSLTIAGLTGKKNQTIRVHQNAGHVGSYKIVECSYCTIDLQDKTQILFLKQLKNCIIRCALAKSTIFVDNCSNCTFELNCHQLRIHNTVDTTFGIFVTSKAIIEDCNRVIFTPYSYQYPNRKQDQIDFQRVNQPNLWRQIQDFNWLKQNQKSPHFELKQAA